MSKSSSEMIKMLKVDGWYEVKGKGSHRNFKHPIKTGKVTIPDPKKDLPLKTIESILEQAGLSKNNP